jgi:hypothetical protein
MAAKAPLSIAPAGGPAQPEVVCSAGDGCSYLRTLATIERIAGFEHSARRYAEAAARCRAQGCTARAGKAAKAAAVVAAAEAVPMKLVAGSQSFARFPRSEGAGKPIPFTRSAFIDILSDADGNFVERRQLKLQTLPATGDPLGYLYRYWLGLRSAGALRFSSIDTVHLARAGVIGSMHVVDVSSGDPNDFRFELFGYAVPITRPEGPRALPVQIYADTTMRDYNTVRLTGVPQLHRMHCRLGDTMHHYTRLILPFMDERDSVDRLCVVIRQERGNSMKVETGH